MAGVRVGKGVGSVAATTYNHVGIPTINAGAAGIRKTVDLTKKHPKAMVPTLTLSAYTGYQAAPLIKRHQLHLDPNIEATHNKAQSPIKFMPMPSINPSIRYKSPQAEQYYKNKNIYI